MSLRFALMLAALLPACASMAATVNPEASQRLLSNGPCAEAQVACSLDLGPVPRLRHIMLGAPRGAIAIGLPPSLRSANSGAAASPGNTLWNAAWDKVDLVPINQAGMLPTDAEKARMFVAGAHPVAVLVAAPGVAYSVPTTPQMAPVQLPALHGLSSTPLAIGLAILAFLAGRRRGLAVVRPGLG